MHLASPLAALSVATTFQAGAPSPLRSLCDPHPSCLVEGWKARAGELIAEAEREEDGVKYSSTQEGHSARGQRKTDAETGGTTYSKGLEGFPHSLQSIPFH